MSFPVLVQILERELTAELGEATAAPLALRIERAIRSELCGRVVEIGRAANVTDAEVADAMRRAGYRPSRAALLLGIPVQALRRRIEPHRDRPARRRIDPPPRIVR